MDSDIPGDRLIQKAQIIVQARRSQRTVPMIDDPDVIEVSQMPIEDLESSYAWALRAMTAMRWNTYIAEH